MRLPAAIVLVSVGIASSAQAQSWWHLGNFWYDYRQYHFGLKRNLVSKKARIPRAASKSEGSTETSSFGIIVEGMIRICGEQALKFRTMRYDVVAKAIQPIADQPSAVDEVRAAASRAADALESGCPNSHVPADPSARLEELKQALGAILASLAIMRPAFKPLYLFEGSNSIDEYHHFDGKSGLDTRPEVTIDTLCYSWVATLRNWPTKLIESALPLSDEQHANLHELAAAIYRAAGAVSSSCKPEDRLTRLGRLNFVAIRLETLRQSIETILPAMVRFEDGLSEEGKKRFEGVVNGTGG